MADPLLAELLLNMGSIVDKATQFKFVGTTTECKRPCIRVTVDTKHPDFEIELDRLRKSLALEISRGMVIICDTECRVNYT